MEKPCNPQLNYRAVIKIYPVFPGPNFRLSLHPLWSPSTKENLWTVCRQSPSVWGEHTWKYSILFPEVSYLWKFNFRQQRKAQLNKAESFSKHQIYIQHRKHFLYNREYLGLSLTFFANYSYDYLLPYENRKYNLHARQVP